MRIQTNHKMLRISFFVVILLSISSPSWAVSFGFTNISNNSGVASSVAEQLSVDISDNGDSALFVFHNIGSISSFIGQIYFDDVNLLIFNSFDTSSTSDGVSFDFTIPGANFPEGNTVSFVEDYDASANNPAPKDGINATTSDLEYLGILFDFEIGASFTQLTSAITDGSFRIGMHVQGINPDDGDYSDSFVSGAPVPEPSTLLLLGAGITGLAFYRRKKK